MTTELFTNVTHNLLLSFNKKFKYCKPCTSLNKLTTVSPGVYAILQSRDINASYFIFFLGVINQAV